ncbi:ComEC/Rec2 family competence protein [Fontisphaera persica]|uniref:ComEC/Rec2 family competence protein n=1 Tax=Fontisphaera persica TaxID=2974023 RepID=UPI0024BFA570|nr:ComEC/Rec2 family competence protein [Fontisphaera persica]WCJ58799.1 ComEC/Rec2 family competence protein [Fontisphaera persica]
MLAVGGFFALGVLAGRYLETSPFGWLAALAAVSLAALLHRRWAMMWTLLIAGLAGGAHVAGWSFPWHSHDLRHLVAEDMVEVEVSGVLAESPLFKPFTRRHGAELFTAAILQVHHLQRDRQPPEPACGLVMVTVPEPLDESFFAGQRVRVRGVLQRPSRALLPGALDYRTHLEHRGIYYLLRTRQAADWLLAGGGATHPPLPARFQAWARQALAHGQPETDDAVKLLWAMLLGWRAGLTDEIAAPFMQSGTMHLFAISGLHIGLLAYVLMSLLRLPGLSLLMARLCVLPLMWFYIAATGWPASAVRAGLMLTVWWSAGLLRRPPQPLNTVCAAAFLILLWQPRQLFQAGFQLSFGVVLGLVLWMPPMTRWLESWAQPDPLALPATSPLAAALRHAWRWLAQAAAASIAAWLASAPLVLYHFSWVTPVCLLANLVMVPLGSLIVAAGAGALLTHGWWPALGEIFNHSAWALMSLQLHCSHAFADLPMGHWPAPRPPWPGLLMYGVVWVCIAAPFLNRRRRMAAATLLTVALLAWAPLAQRIHPSTVTILPLEDGYSILVREPGWAALLDTGRPLPAERHVTPFLRAQGLARLDALILTHGDLGQMGGLSCIVSEFQPRQILHGPLWHRSPAYRDWLQSTQHATLRQAVAAGFQLHTWQLLHPAADDPLGAADDSPLVWRRESPHGACLLLSDLSRAGQNQLAQRLPPHRLRADLLICGLPEQGEPLADGFLRLVQPRLVIVADNLYPADRRAPSSLSRRLARQRVALWCTRECGAVEIQFTSTSWRATAMDGRCATPDLLPGWQPPPDLENSE